MDSYKRINSDGSRVRNAFVEITIGNEKCVLNTGSNEDITYAKIGKEEQEPTSGMENVMTERWDVEYVRHDDIPAESVLRAKIKEELRPKRLEAFKTWLERTLG